MTLRYYLKPVRMAKNKNTDDNLYWRECGISGTLPHCWWECKLIQPLWKSLWYGGFLENWESIKLETQ